MIAGFLSHFGIVFRWRAAMRLSLADLREQPTLPEGYHIVPWDESRLREVAAVDHRAYRGTIDGLLYERYFSSVEGCLRMWQESVGGRFGQFDPARTLLLMRDEVVCGDVMASVTRTDEAFIGNLAVDPGHRGGTGRALLLTCLWMYRQAGFQRVSLAVTFDNRRAFRIYESLGFRVAGRFPVMCRPQRLERIPQ